MGFTWRLLDKALDHELHPHSWFYLESRQWVSLYVSVNAWLWSAVKGVVILQERKGTAVSIQQSIFTAAGVGYTTGKEDLDGAPRKSTIIFLLLAFILHTRFFKSSPYSPKSLENVQDLMPIPLSLLATPIFLHNSTDCAISKTSQHMYPFLCFPLLSQYKKYFPKVFFFTFAFHFITFSSSVSSFLFFL